MSVQTPQINPKIFGRGALATWVANERSKGHRIGLTCGVFDLLHAGHVEYLTRARERCDRLIVAVNSDISVRIYKSPLRPLNKQEHRVFVVAGLASVDAVTLMPEPRPEALIELLKPDLYVKGGDYTPDDLKSRPLIESFGGQVVCIPIAFDTSTSAILDLASAIELHAAAPEFRPDSGRRRLAFLDRDGTLIRDVPFLHHPGMVELMPGVLEGLKALQDAGFTLVIVTNQQGIGLGYYNESDFIEVNRALFRKLAPAGIRISRIYYCPHSYADQCRCRKPGSLLLEEALSYYGAAPEHCCLIGDSTDDCIAAQTAGCLSILVSSQPAETPCSYSAYSFNDAVQWVLRHVDCPALET